eukprot:326496-Chlamydomonas_euryale.AAC.3
MVAEELAASDAQHMVWVHWQRKERIGAGNVRLAPGGFGRECRGGTEIRSKGLAAPTAGGQATWLVAMPIVCGHASLFVAMPI